MTSEDLLSKIKLISSDLILGVEGKERTVKTILKCSTKIYPEEPFYLIVFADASFIEVSDSAWFCDGKKTHIDRSYVTDYGEYLHFNNDLYHLDVVDDAITVLETLYGEANIKEGESFSEYRYASHIWRFVKQNDEDAYDLFLKNIDLKDIRIIHREA